MWMVLAWSCEALDCNVDGLDWRCGQGGGSEGWQCGGKWRA